MPPVQEFPHYVEFRHVYKTFDKPVLVDSNFYIDAGETVAVIGRSGVGKSVSLGHIMGFLKPDKGRVIVAHEDITDFSEAELRRIRKKVTMVFQSGALFDSMTVGENIEFSLELREDYDMQNKEELCRGYWIWWIWGNTGTFIRRTCPPVSNERWQSRGRWRRSRNAFCTMSRRRWWTRS